MASSLSNSSECRASGVQMLRDVFPNIDRQKISDILVASGMDLEKAINKILSESGTVYMHRAYFYCIAFLMIVIIKLQ
jgi:hypothetical protein